MKMKVRPGYCLLDAAGKPIPNMREIEDTDPILKGQGHKVEPMEKAKPMKASRNKMTSAKSGR